MTFNHYIYLYSTYVDDSPCIRICVNGMSVYVFDLLSLQVYDYMASYFQYDGDYVGDINLPDKLLVSVDRKLSLLSAFRNKRAYDSILYSKIVSIVTKGLGKDSLGCDLHRFIRLFMTKNQINECYVV